MGDAAISALNSLLRSSGIEDHAEALRLATSAAKAAKPGSADLEVAQHSRVVALLKLDRFEDALSAVADGGSALENRCLLERVYALYKVGRLAEADEALAEQLKDGSHGDRGVRHIAAQIAYRAEKFDTAAGIYRQLIGEDGGRLAEDNDLKINLLATNAQLEWQGRGDRIPEQDRKPAREDMEAFETGYNAACGCAARGEFAKAVVLLKRAADLCEASEELSPEEKKVELLPILIQQVFVLAKLDKEEEAAELQKVIGLSE
jgi:signal recognition particle subunit SRP72